MRCFPLAALVVGSMFAGLVVGQCLAKDPRSPEEGNESPRKLAIAKGALYLKKAQSTDGRWKSESGEESPLTTGMTALAALALIKAEPLQESPELRKALEILKNTKLESTYTVSLETEVFASDGPARNLDLVQKTVKWLEDAQVTKGVNRGSWNYIPGGDRGDGSCSRFAILALQAAQRAGVEVKPETWKLAREYWTSSQHADGSWSYQPAQGVGTMTMTLAGIASIAIADRALQPAPGQAAELAVPLKDGLHWASQRYADTDYEKVAWLLYQLDTLKTACTATAQGKLGDHDWQTEMTALLIKQQDSQTGVWRDPACRPNPAISTSLAILFLAD